MEPNTFVSHHTIPGNGVLKLKKAKLKLKMTEKLEYAIFCNPRSHVYQRILNVHHAPSNGGAPLRWSHY